MGRRVLADPDEAFKAYKKRTKLGWFKAAHRMTKDQFMHFNYPSLTTGKGIRSVVTGRQRRERQALVDAIGEERTKSLLGY